VPTPTRRVCLTLAADDDVNPLRGAVHDQETTDRLDQPPIGFRPEHRFETVDVQERPQSTGQVSEPMNAARARSPSITDLSYQGVSVPLGGSQCWGDLDHMPGARFANVTA
jgi:hypothetical protein